ncbi:glycosyltransferase family 9 protein [Quadrisphaera sp. DSM 44207]|uniref:glycosyltransferase family 9 protein n=1 Tax=Quadrisphaera sp. DSM 44207 TaxID=1881057 RepID=UPI001C409B9A|nr:glycosyltransferase family 9 protein [Quadrisphaera sp. DSM 44207]
MPALRGLRRRWPAARLVLAAPAGVGGLLRDLGVVDAVLPVTGLAPLAPDALVRADRAHPEALGGRGVDVGVNLHGNGPQSARALAALAPAATVAFAGPAHPSGPAWSPDEHEVLRWCRLVRSAGGRCGPEDLLLDAPRHDAASARRGGPVVVHPGAASGSRRWPAQRWERVVTALAARGHRVLVSGGPAEGALCAQVAAAGGEDLAGALSLRELLDVVASARLLVCGDTGVAHVATAVRTPSVLLFGPVCPALWGPAVDADRHVVLWPAPPGHRGDPHAAAVDPVLARTRVEDVVAAAERLLV